MAKEGAQNRPGSARNLGWRGLARGASTFQWLLDVSNVPQSFEQFEEAVERGDLDTFLRTYSPFHARSLILIQF
jgi:hypothetical protein